jgi:hypothetical protein
MLGNDLDVVEVHEASDYRTEKSMCLLASRSWDVRRYRTSSRELVLPMSVAKEGMQRKGYRLSDLVIRKIII